MSDVEERSAEPVEGEALAETGPSAGVVEAAGARVCEVALEEFEGPLDLLLHLVRRHELEILDIPISFVCERYLEYIEFMQALDLEVAGDYLVMAATLAYLKSRELLPHGAPELAEDGTVEEGPDPREQLIARLLEYQKFKDAASNLNSRPIAGRDTFGRGQEIELPPVDAGLAPLTLFRLADAYQRVLERARIHRSHEVTIETISVATRMQQLTEILIDRGRFDFVGLFLERSWSNESELRSMLVVTLMSVLEMVRMGVASVEQSTGADTIVVERLASAEEARAALADYDEAVSFGARVSEEEALEDEASEDGAGASWLGEPTEEPAEPAKDGPEAATEPSELDLSAGVSARSVVSEPPREELASGSTVEGDGDEHGENGEAEAVEGS